MTSPRDYLSSTLGTTILILSFALAVGGCDDGAPAGSGLNADAGSQGPAVDFSAPGAYDASAGGEGADQGVGGPSGLGIDPECDLDEVGLYENFVLAEDCPGPCCWEHPGTILRDDPKRLELIRPTIHSAYHDYPTTQLKSDVPSEADGLRFYVPVAHYRLDDHLEERQVGCLADADCAAIGAGLLATCSRQDGDADGTPYEISRLSEYQACLDGMMCVDTGGYDGDLATQSAVPQAAVDGLCGEVAVPGEGMCEERLSMCVYSPAWISQPSARLADEEGRAAPIVRPSGRLFVQGLNLVDTNMSAYFVRVRSANRDGPQTDFLGMKTDPVSGEPVVRMRNGMQCAFDADGEGDCDPRDRQGEVQLAAQTETYTRGAEASLTRGGLDTVPPMYWYLERERQWLRYHRSIQDSEEATEGFAELYDDLAIVEVPDEMAPGLYALQLGYSANAWLGALEEQLGRGAACRVLEAMRDECIAGFDNPTIGELRCSDFAIDCADDGSSPLLDRDRSLLTNPIYVQVAPNFVEQSYRFSVDSFRPIVSGEYGPRPGGPWVYDDVRFFSMMVRFDPTQLDEDESCTVGVQDGGPENPVCHVSGPWVYSTDDVVIDQVYPLSGDGFSAEISVRPGEVVNIITFVFESDGAGNEDELFGVLDGADGLLGGVARIVAGAYGQEGLGAGVAGAINGIFGLTENIITSFTNPELIALSVTSYTSDELALLTMAQQMGLDRESLLETAVPSLVQKPALRMDFQNHDYTIRESLRLPEVLAWGAHQETRRFEVEAPGAADLICGPEGVALNSCSYRGNSTYDIQFSISHLRGE